MMIPSLVSGTGMISLPSGPIARLTLKAATDLAMLIQIDESARCIPGHTLQVYSSVTSLTIEQKITYRRPNPKQKSLGSCSGLGPMNLSGLKRMGSL